MKKKQWLILLAFCIGLASFIPSAGASEAITPQQRLAIYYGWPSVVNGAAGNVTTATSTFAQFDIIVLGAGLEETTHGDHANTVSIINNLNSIGGKKVFGYINLGCGKNPNPAVVKDQIDKWSTMNVYGVFLDCAGFDYSVTRTIQNDVTDYAHAKSLKVFMNAWNPDQIGGDLNENGVYQPTHVGVGDWYLAESWLISSNTYLSISDWSAKADKCLTYKRIKGIETTVIATNAPNSALPTDNTTDKFKMAWWAAAMYGFPFQWSDIWYSGGNNTLNYYASPANYGTSFTGDPIHNSGSTSNYRTTDTGMISVVGNGSSAGTGAFTPI